MNAILSIAMASSFESRSFPTERSQNLFYRGFDKCIIVLFPKQSCPSATKTREFYFAMKKLLESSDVESVTCAMFSLKLYGGPTL